jgi:hypothetical protein
MAAELGDLDGENMRKSCTNQRTIAGLSSVRILVSNYQNARFFDVEKWKKYFKDPSFQIFLQS